MMCSMDSSFTLTSPAEAQQSLGRALARARLGRNWSQQALAARAGVSLPTLSRLERGHGVGLDAFLKIAAALDMLDAVVQAVEAAQLPAARFQTLDALEKQLTPRRRGRSGG